MSPMHKTVSCPNCGASVEVTGQKELVCGFCETKFLAEEKKKDNRELSFLNGINLEYPSSSDESGTPKSNPPITKDNEQTSTKELPSKSPSPASTDDKPAFDKSKPPISQQSKENNPNNLQEEANTSRQNDEKQNYILNVVRGKLSEEQKKILDKTEKQINKRIVTPKTKRGNLSMIVVWVILTGIAVIYNLATSDKKTTYRNAIKYPANQLLKDQAVYGDLQSSANLSVYLDYECPYSRLLFIQLIRLIKEKKGFSLRFFHYPLVKIHKGAMFKAKVANCAARHGKFLSISAFFFKNRHKKNFEKKYLAQLAGMSLSELNTCLNSKRIKKRLELDLETAKINKINGVPTVFINGKKLKTWKYLKQRMGLR